MAAYASIDLASLNRSGTSKDKHHSTRTTLDGRLMNTPSTPLLFKIPRRTLLQGLGLLAGTACLPASITPVLANTAPSDDFTRLSLWLTGRRLLPADFSQALQEAFTRLDAGFPDQVTRLLTYLNQHQPPAEGLADHLLANAETADLAGLPRQILTGWYLGVVGQGKEAVCVTYTEALANKNVGDILRPPSYSYGAYGTWAEKPV